VLYSQQLCIEESIVGFAIKTGMIGSFLAFLYCFWCQLFSTRRNLYIKKKYYVNLRVISQCVVMTE